MAEHRSVTTTIPAPSGTAVVHFHCPCGITRREVIVIGPDAVHPAERYTAAIRRLHQRGQWPLAEPLATVDVETEEPAA